ncbi:MAG TPA: hypothetical protein VIJ59_05505 [Caulobacteraceae bacterium]
MSNTALVVIIVVAVIIVAAIIWFAARRRTSTQLKTKFGTEYSRLVEETGSQHKAETELHDREQRVKRLTVRPLSVADRTRFVDSWKAVQSRFVDDPGGAVGDADTLIVDVMTARGYPMAEFEQRSADISVDHPEVVQNYRTAHDIAVRHGQGGVDTEELRKSMIAYRALFDDLVGERTGDVTTPTAAPAAPIVADTTVKDSPAVVVTPTAAEAATEIVEGTPHDS